MINFLNLPVESTLPFWQLLSDEFKNINISYGNICNEQQLIKFLDLSDNTDLFLLDFSGESVTNYDIWINRNFSKFNGKPFVKLTCNPLHFFKTDEITAFLPIWYYDVYHTNYKVRLKDIKPEYLVSCLNRAVKLPRIYNLVKLFKNKSLENPKLLFTFKPYEVYISDDTLPPNHDSRIIYPQDLDWSVLELAIKQTRKSLPDDELAEVKRNYNFLFNDLPLNPLAEDLSKVLDDHTTNHPAYTKSFSNLITESDVGNIFYTEKTFKALAFGIPFWLQAAPNSSLFLDLFNFDTYKDIDVFHYETYDRSHNFVERTDIIVSLVKVLLEDQTISKLNLTNRYKKNQEYFYSSKVYNLFLDQIKQKIKKVLA